MKRALLIFLLFVELVVIGSLAATVAIGGLPQTLAGLFYSGVVLLAVAAAIAFALPPQWSERASLHGALVAGATLFALPFVWLVGTSFKYPEETFVTPPQWVPAAAYPQARSPYEDGEVERRFMLGPPAVRNADGEAYDVPPDARTFAAGEGATLEPVDDRDSLVRYDLSDRDAFQIDLDIDEAWLAKQLEGEEPAVFSLTMRQDRTWHGYDVAIEHGGVRYESEDALHLGDYRWRAVSFRPMTPDAVANAPVGRDERNLGVFPLQPIGDAPPGTRLTMTVHKTGQVAATWAKYTDTYRQAWYSDPYWGRYLFNSLWLVALNVLGQIIACSTAAFAFSRLQWPGRNGVFVLLLATMMLPTFVTMIPTFLIFRSLGWYNTLLPLWVPAFAGTPFYIFLLRQFMLGIPRELEEAAKIDGCGWFGIYFRIVMPLMKPALATVAIFTFLATWNEFMGPLIYLSDERLYPLSLGLFKFRSQYESEFGMLMAASTLMTLPVIALFFLCQRYFIEGTTLTGLKG